MDLSPLQDGTAWTKPGAAQLFKFGMHMTKTQRRQIEGSLLPVSFATGDAALVAFRRVNTSALRGASWSRAGDLHFAIVDSL